MEFKLLTLITVLAENHLAYRGTLSDMCRFIGLAANNSRTNARINQSFKSHSRLTVKLQSTPSPSQTANLLRIALLIAALKK